MKSTTYTAFFVYHILPYSFRSIVYYCIYGCTFCRILFNFVNYVFLLLLLCIRIVIMFRSVYSVSRVVLLIACVYMCTVLLSPGVNPIAVNKYITSLHVQKAELS